MKYSKSNISTGSSSEVQSRDWFKSMLMWGEDWWLVLLLIMIFLCAGITKYIYPQQKVYSLMTDLIKAISVIMVVMYVIYTRLLSLETKKMAEASLGLFKSEKGTVLIELFKNTCAYKILCEDAQNVTKEVHLVEKKLGEREYNKLMTDENIAAIFCKIKNFSGRRIEASRIEYKARHTGSDKIYDVTCDISKMGSISPWEDKEICLIAAPEGEIEIIINSIYYIDGGIEQKLIDGRKIILERIRNPENRQNG